MHADMALWHTLSNLAFNTHYVLYFLDSVPGLYFSSHLALFPSTVFKLIFFLASKKYIHSSMELNGDTAV